MICPRFRLSVLWIGDPTGGLGDGASDWVSNPRREGGDSDETHNGVDGSVDAEWVSGSISGLLGGEDGGRYNI